MTGKLKNTMAGLKEKTTGIMKGEIPLTQLDFCLLCLNCLLLGICIGLLAAPVTHGVTMWSHNGNNNGSHNGNQNCTNNSKEEENL